jgi:hypothetical protein
MFVSINYLTLVLFFKKLNYFIPTKFKKNKKMFTQKYGINKFLSLIQKKGKKDLYSKELIKALFEILRSNLHSFKANVGKYGYCFNFSQIWPFIFNNFFVFFSNYVIKTDKKIRKYSRNKLNKYLFI